MAIGKDSVRFAVTMTKTTLERIDNYANSLGIARSAAISVLCSSMLNSIDLTESLKRIDAQDAQRAPEKPEDRESTLDH